MIGRRNRLFVASIAAIAISWSVVTSTMDVAEAVLIPQEEHWKYQVRWMWDPKMYENVGLISPQIVIENETADRLEGYIADANRTRLSMYDDGMQLVMVKYMFDSGLVSRYEIADKIHDGYFAIDIPEKYREAETLRIYIGTFNYYVDTKPQFRVFINSATMNYRTDPALDESTTQAAALVNVPQLPPRSIYEQGSLIDWILIQNGLLSVGSSYSGK